MRENIVCCKGIFEFFSRSFKGIHAQNNLCFLVETVDFSLPFFAQLFFAQFKKPIRNGLQHGWIFEFFVFAFDFVRIDTFKLFPRREATSLHQPVSAKKIVVIFGRAQKIDQSPPAYHLVSGLRDEGSISDTPFGIGFQGTLDYFIGILSFFKNRRQCGMYPSYRIIM